MKGRIAAGVGLVNFVGHAGVERLTSNGLLLSTDVPFMNNSGTPFFMTALTCAAGQFSIPGAISVAEALVITNNMGSAGVWSSVGESDSVQVVILGKEFYRALFEGGHVRVGTVIVDAVQQAYIQGVDKHMLYINNLLGDPALILN